ncbi:amino acid transporter AVT3B-like [Camellia sinensis]|uniref:Amino acid transporter transmembrane domain-containing protein n=1 Tax=Camellia sinensis var. sinensis TaxID=542762 RepID=A0A4S4EFM9_CAMSN|nr:amino acid transporter AVT3B-like [Camellia sinensis]THG15213.1 hypothetical protein TEA_019286 [Camellia sinensis var. sinensis]
MGLGRKSSSSSSDGHRSSSSSSSSSLPREDTPLLIGSNNNNNNNNSLSSQPKVFANLFIAVVGAGVLGLPYTFMKTGWLTSLLMIFSVAALTYHCMMLLVRIRKKLDSNNNNNNDSTKINSFGDLGYAVCGSLGRLAVDSMIILTQAGFCIGYLIFIANTLANLFNSSPLTNLRLPSKILGISAKSFYIWGSLPFQLGLNAIPTLTLLAPLSIFADIVDVGAMGIVIAENFSTFMKHRPIVEPFGSLSAFFYGLGVAVYSFEGVGMVLPLESEAKDKNKFGKILGITMAFIASTYGLFGALGYFAFGQNTRDIITANMGTGLLSALVQLGLCINLFFTFPLMMHPVYEVVERRLSNGKYCLWMRWVLVTVVIMVALFVPNFTDFLSLVGSSVCCALGFVLPALFHYLVFKDEMDRKGACLDIGIVILGTVIGVLGIWSSISEIVSVKARL